MKLTAAEIEIQCNLLDKQLYPAADSALESAILFCVDPDTDSEVQHLSYLLFRIRNEFESLIHFERKLVFKALINTAKMIEKGLAHISVNVDELSHLIKNKDRKIIEYIHDLEHTSLAYCEPVKALVLHFEDLFESKKSELYRIMESISASAASLNTEQDFQNIKDSGHVDQD